MTHWGKVYWEYEAVHCWECGQCAQGGGSLGTPFMPIPTSTVLEPPMVTGDEPEYEAGSYDHLGPYH